MKLLPFEYAVRNLGRSPLRLAMSLLGSTLVVMLVITAAAFIRGMQHGLAQSGSLGNVMLLGAGSEESIERSEISAAVPGQATASIRGIKTRLATPLFHLKFTWHWESAPFPMKRQVGRWLFAV